jgi:type IV secretory pathway TrbD component
LEKEAENKEEGHMLAIDQQRTTAQPILLCGAHLVQMMMGVLAGVLVLVRLSPMFSSSSLTLKLNISFLSGAPGGDLPSSLLDN